MFNYHLHSGRGYTVRLHKGCTCPCGAPLTPSGFVVEDDRVRYVCPHCHVEILHAELPDCPEPEEHAPAWSSAEWEAEKSRYPDEQENRRIRCEEPEDA